jgi:valyl-tRNA synthetase
MSKSKGNVVVPNDLLDEHGSDAVRYWAASARLGTDAAFDVGQMKVGRRLSIKVLNAAKFVLSFETKSEDVEVTEPIDRAMLGALSEVVAQAGKAFDGYDHTKALELTETFFWTFTDDYLELVKERAYGQATTPEAQASAVFALRIALHTLLRLLAPFIPFATEEAWSWWQEKSIHLARWPQPSELEVFTKGQSGAMLQVASEALMGVRKAKSDQQLSMKADISSLTIKAPADKLEQLRQLEADIRAVGRIENLAFVNGEEVAISNVTFKPAL